MRINHNSLALNASDHFEKINSNITKSMQRLSSGKKITSPADDAAGLAISTKMDAQIRGLKRASLNSNDGISVIQSAEGGLSEIHSILARMRELAVKASNDVLSEEDRDAVQVELDSLRDEIDQIAGTTSFNEQHLLDGSMTRRSLSSNANISATYLSEEVSVGVYALNVTSVAKQASVVSELRYSNAKISAAQAGTITVNGFSVDIEKGMTMTEVFETLQEHLHKINVDVLASNNGGRKEVDFSSGAPVVIRNQNYGADEKLNIDISNKRLAKLLGIADGTSVAGRDCKVNLTTTKDGFTATASAVTKGNNVTIVDRNGFEMNVEVSSAMTTAGETKIEVFSAGTMVVQTGANSGEQVTIDIPKVDAKGLGIDNLVMYTHDYANKAIAAIDEAVKKVSKIRSKLGAYENRLEDIYDNLETQGESLTAAFSRIMDTDMAEEMTNYTKEDVLAQAAISMMKRSNERPESVLQLLQQ